MAQIHTETSVILTSDEPDGGWDLGDHRRFVDACYAAELPASSVVEVVAGEVICHGAIHPSLPAVLRLPTQEVPA